MAGVIDRCMQGTCRAGGPWGAKWLLEAAFRLLRGKAGAVYGTQTWADFGHCWHHLFFLFWVNLPGMGSWMRSMSRPIF